ncbi:FMRFamide receptor [Lamellibrachia satsuma]|nr:FMRFamide receptor [Lamellibrachia satsuma]
MASMSYGMSANGSDDALLTVNMTGNGSVALGAMMDPRPVAPSDDQLSLFRFVCEVGLSMPIAIIGIMTNVVSFIVLATQKHRLTTTVLLQALAVADSLVLVCTLLMRSLPVLHTLTESLGSYITAFPQIFVYLYPAVFFIRLTDTWLTILLTIDRYIAVCHPLQAQRVCTMVRAYKHMVIVLICSLVFSIPRFFEYTLSENKYVPTSLIRNHVYTVVYRITMFSVCMYLVPMATLVILNWRLLSAMRRANQFRSVLYQSAESLRDMSPPTTTNRSVTIIVVIVVIVCVTCNVTALASHLLWSLQECFAWGRHLTKQRRYMSHINNVLITFNSAVNFFIYCLCSRNFRSGLTSGTRRCRALYSRPSKMRSDRECRSML